MGLVIDVAVARTHKYGSRESGDSAEVVERPGGGVSLIVIDGQGSGWAARAISQMLVARASALIGEGSRDAAVAAVTSDLLYAQRLGQVSATLDLVTVDPGGGDLTVLRQGDTVAVVRHEDGTDRLDERTAPLGRYRRTEPRQRCYPLRPGLLAVIATDGVTGSGRRFGRPPWDFQAEIDAAGPELAAADLAERLLAAAIERDAGRLSDDATVGVVRVLAEDGAPAIRRASMRLPVIWTPPPAGPAEETSASVEPGREPVGVAPEPGPADAGPAFGGAPGRATAPGAGRDVVIVGTCASGKSTLAEGLGRLGYPVRVVAQEHSDVAGLWRRHDPAVVIGLETPLETVRQRRGRTWSAAVYERQVARLRPAMAAARLVIDTASTSPMATLALAAAAIREAGVRPGPAIPPAELGSDGPA